MREILSTGIKVKTYEVLISIGKCISHRVTPFKAKFRDCEKWRSSQSTSLLSFLIHLPIQVFKRLQYPLAFNYRNRAWPTLCIKRPNSIPRKRMYIRQYLRCISFFLLIQDSLWWSNNFIIWRSECCGEGNGNSLQYSCLENLMDRGTCQAIVNGVTKKCNMIYQLNKNSNICDKISYVYGYI